MCQSLESITEMAPDVFQGLVPSLQAHFRCGMNTNDWYHGTWTCFPSVIALLYDMSLVMRKPVFGVFDQVRLKPVYRD